MEVETTDQFDSDYKRLDRAVQRRVMAYLEEVGTLDYLGKRGKAFEREPCRSVALSRR